MSQLIGCAMFHWSQYYSDRQQSLTDHWDDAFSVLRDAGISAVELTIASDQEAEQLSRLLVKNALALPSVYLGGKLCEEDWEETAKRMIQQAEWGKRLGAKTLVTNPDPLNWNEPIDKDDDQLRRQATALKALTRELTAMDMTLAYHTHAPEMRQSAREFHHMLLATREVGMKFCLDFHWIYRGAGNSQIATEDLIELYGDRVVTTHIRQSHGGVWSESLEDGDLEYSPLADKLKAFKYGGPLMIECAREQGTSIVPSMLEAYKASVAWTKSTFNTTESN